MASIDPYLPIIFDMAKKSEIVLEIGVHRGNTTNTILSALEKDAFLISIDKTNPIDFKTDSKQWSFIKSDCMDYIISAPVDFLMIDCDPELELFEKILEKYGKRVKKFMAIHDTTAYGLTECVRKWARANKFKITKFDNMGLGFIALEHDRS